MGGSERARLRARYCWGGRSIPDVGGGRARASVCLSRVIYGGAAGASAEAAAAASCNCGSPHLLFGSLILLSAPPHTRPWGVGPPAGTSSPLGPVGTSCRLPGRGLRERRVPRALARCPGLAARSPGWRGAPLAPTDSERERESRCPAAPRQQRSGVRGQGRGCGEETLEILNPGKVQGLCRFPRGRRGKRRSSASLC